ncbi:MAG TPA: hypothetical protein VIU62_21070 [Chloroflexota bacterium]
MIDAAYGEDLLAEIWTSRTQAQRRRLHLCLQVIRAALRGQTKAVRNYVVLWRINAANSRHLQLAEAEVWERLPLADGSKVSPRRRR